MKNQSSKGSGGKTKVQAQGGNVKNRPPRFVDRHYEIAKDINGHR